MRDERQRAAARNHEIERLVGPRERLDVGLREMRLGAAASRPAEEARREIDSERLISELTQDDGLEAGPAARVERPRTASFRRWRELGPQEIVEDRVEVLVPGLEIVVGCGHRIEEGAGPGHHGASVANA